MKSVRKESIASKVTLPKVQCHPITPSLKVNISTTHCPSMNSTAAASIIVPQEEAPPKGILKRRDIVYREEKVPVPGVTFVGSSPQMVGYVLRQPSIKSKPAKKKVTSTRFETEEEELEEKKKEERIVREILKLQTFELRCISLSDRRNVLDKLEGFMAVAERDMEKKRNRLRDKLLHEDVNLLRQLTAESQTRDETILQGKVKEMLQLKKEKDEIHEEKVKELIAKYKESIDYDSRQRKLEQFRKETRAALLEQIEENKLLKEKEKEIEKAFVESFLLDKI